MSKRKLTTSFLSIILTLAMIFSMTLFTVNAAISSNIDFDTVTWKNKNGDDVTKTGGIIAVGDYVYADQEFNIGERDGAEGPKALITDGAVAFDIKMEKVPADVPDDWVITFNLLDQAIGKAFYEDGTAQICFQYYPKDKKLVASVLHGVENGDKRQFGDSQTFNNIDIADGEWHTLKLSAGKNSWGDNRKMSVGVSVDGLLITPLVVWHSGDGFTDAGKGFTTFFPKGKFSILANPDKYDVSIRKASDITEAWPVVDNGPLNIAEAIEKGYVKKVSGDTVNINDGVIEAGLERLFYFEQDVTSPAQHSFMMKLDKKEGLTEPNAGWQICLSLIDMAVGSFFWQDNAKNINLQINDFGDGIGGTLNFVYKDGSTAVFNPADSSFESDVTLFDGEWHRISMAYKPIDDGRGWFVCKIDGKDFINFLMTAGTEDAPIDLNNYFEKGMLSVYNGKEEYNISIKAATETDGDLLAAANMPKDKEDNGDGEDKDKDKDKDKGKDKDKNPNGGETLPVVAFAVCGISILFVVLMIKRKKQA